MTTILCDFCDEPALKIFSAGGIETRRYGCLMHTDTARLAATDGIEPRRDRPRHATLSFEAVAAILADQRRERGPTTRVVLIGCGKAKLDHAAPARDLYTGSLFQAALEVVDHGGFDAAYVLSARHGITALDEVLQPYDATLKGWSKREREAWGHRISGDLVSRHPGPVEVTALAGADYCAPVRCAIIGRGAMFATVMPPGPNYLDGTHEWSSRGRVTWSEPLARLGVGARLRRLGEFARAGALVAAIATVGACAVDAAPTPRSDVAFLDVFGTVDVPGFAGAARGTVAVDGDQVAGLELYVELPDRWAEVRFGTRPDGAGVADLVVDGAVQVGDGWTDVLYREPCTFAIAAPAVSGCGVEVR